LHEIGRVFGNDHVSIQFMVAPHDTADPPNGIDFGCVLADASDVLISNSCAYIHIDEEIQQELWRGIGGRGCAIQLHRLREEIVGRIVGI
jgi:hypothetical protein